MSLNAGTKLAVFSIRTGSKGGSIWVRAGTAFVNRDNSVNVLLDVLPMDGRLHLRELVVEKKEPTQTQGQAPAQVPADVVATMDAAMAMGGAA